MRKLIGAGSGRPLRADMAVFACLLRKLEPFWSLRVLIVSEDGETASSRYVSPSSETRHSAFFNGC